MAATLLFGLLAVFAVMALKAWRWRATAIPPRLTLQALRRATGKRDPISMSLKRCRTMANRWCASAHIEGERSYLESRMREQLGCPYVGLLISQRLIEQIDAERDADRQQNAGDSMGDLAC